MEKPGENILAVETVAFNENKDAAVIIDQTRLPGETALCEIRTAEELYDAIYLLKVRGAPAIGVCAAIGISVIAKSYPVESDTEAEYEKNFESFYRFFKEKKDYINSSRPTAVNLSWALNRMEKRLCSAKEECKSISGIKEILIKEAELIKEEDTEVCRRIGENALSLLHKGDGIITHCNAGQLATSRYGTATAALYLGKERGYGFRVYCDETRPLLQGARLTSYELSSAGLDVTLLCDNMSASLMSRGLVQAAIVGCDRVAANGDTANKIGTLMLALAAKRYNIPFYVAAPLSTIDFSAKTGADIPIENRSAEEVTEMWYKERTAPEGIKVYNPAFDVTPADLITAIITEQGIYRPCDLEKTIDK